MQKKDVIVVGMHSAEVALKYHPENILSFYMEKDLSPKQAGPLLEQLKNARISPERVKAETLDKFAEGVSHQGVGVKLKLDQVHEKDLLASLEVSERPALLLILDGVHNPHNLGACLRSAESFGVDAVVIPSQEAVGLTPAVSKSACGAEQLVPLVQVSNLVRFIEALKKLNIWVAGLSAQGTRMVHELDAKGPMALVMGQEGRGLKRLTEEHCDWLVKIPMLGRTSSLNLSAAASITLYEVTRQRQGK